jgi:hypothetical protein
MNSADVVGYTYDGEFYCVDCWEGDVDEETGVVFADSEWDYYPTCGTCHEQCKDVSLTSEGELYETEANGPQEDDYTTTDYQHWYQYAKLVVTVGEDGDWRIAVMAHMDEESFWPNVWAVSDHGNTTLLSMEDNSNA